eukprot:Skav224032  [mRNA]  locus=scaffold4539:36039:46311:- [translate_table: standard]
MASEPIDLDAASSQLVPLVDLDDDASSPNKRQRQLATLEKRDLVNLIQSTITTSLEGHLGQIQSSLSTIVQDQSNQATRLTRLETITGDHQHTLKQMQQNHTQRLDHLQAEIVQLQKGSAPSSAQASPTNSPSSFRAVGPLEEPSFDLVIGGWKEGLSKETVQHQISTLLGGAHLLDDMAELRLFGKRPTIGKLILKFDDGMTIAAKRERQLRLRESVRNMCEGKDLWCTMDKPPKMRVIGKAVGRLSGFLQQKFQLTKDDLVVGSWALAKCFVGEHLITGLAGQTGARPPADPTHLRWLIQDDHNAVHVWVDLPSLAAALSHNPADLIKTWDLHFGTAVASAAQRQHAQSVVPKSEPSPLFQYGCWNIQGKPLTHCIDTLLSSDIDFHVLGVQEATLPPTETLHEQGGLPEVSYHQGYTILHAWTTGCFRRLALCLEDDFVTKWAPAKSGHSHLLVQVWFSFLATPVTIVVVHLPHSGRPLVDFQAACIDLQRDLQHSVQRHVPVLVLGDLNHPIHLQESVGERATLLNDVLTNLDLMHFSVDGLPTWRARRIDHILYNSSFVDLSCLIGSSHCPWATLQVRSDLQAILEVDHALLLCETLFRVEVASSDSKQRRRLRANFFRQRPCKMMVTDDAAIQSFVYTHVGQSHLHPGNVYSSLTRLVSSCSRPVPSQRYVDPPPVKELCRQRSLCTDPAARRDYSFQILRLRAAARRDWHKSLVTSAACGHWPSRRLLRRRRPLPVATRSPDQDFAGGSPTLWEASEEGLLQVLLLHSAIGHSGNVSQRESDWEQRVVPGLSEEGLSNPSRHQIPPLKFEDRYDVVTRCHTLGATLGPLWLERLVHCGAFLSVAATWRKEAPSCVLIGDAGHMADTRTLCDMCPRYGILADGTCQQ